MLNRPLPKSISLQNFDLMKPRHKLKKAHKFFNNNLPRTNTIASYLSHNKDLIVIEDPMESIENSAKINLKSFLKHQSVVN